VSVNPTVESFLKDVTDHKLTILRDDGLYRHVRLSRPDSNVMRFDLVTWPGYLAYAGDMGDFVFSRLADMFEFFRSRPGTLDVNHSYWAEKIQATDKGSGHTRFDVDRFCSVVNEYRLGWIREAARNGKLTKTERRELWNAVDDDVLSKACDGEYPALNAANEFYFQTQRAAGRHDLSYQFDDFLEHDFASCTFRFLWCCYAIAWGIQQYDAAKEKTIST
jgi:hypothetical protein